MNISSREITPWAPFSLRDSYLFIRLVKQYFMARNLHTCNCLLVLMIAWLLVERLIKAVLDQNVS